LCQKTDRGASGRYIFGGLCLRGPYSAEYAQDRQVCGIQFARHCTPDQPDARPILPPELETELIDEIVPSDPRGSRIGKWLGNALAGAE